MSNYPTAHSVLNNIEKCIKELENAEPHKNKERIKAQLLHKTRKGFYFRYSFFINNVYDELSIFDWWNDVLSMSQLKDMRKFVRTAIELGYDGYVCFKVGATGCANGMWAHKRESTDGYSPDGKALYKSFTPAYNYWSFCDETESWFPLDREKYDEIKTIKQLKEAIATAKQEGADV